MSRFKPKFKNCLAKTPNGYLFKFQGKDGKFYHGATGCFTLAAAEQVLRQKREDAALRAVGVPPASDAPTLADLARKWARAQELRKGLGTTHVRNVMGHCGMVRDPQSGEWVRAKGRAYLKQLLGLRVSKIRPADAEGVVDAYLSVKGNTAGGANSVLRSLGLLVGFALKRGYLTHRPLFVDLLPVQEKPKPFLPAERLAEFFQVLQAQGAPLRAQRLCWLMVTLGLRESEARHARIEHTDLVNLWHTPYDPEVGTKGGEAKPVPIFPWAAPEIAAMVGERKAGLLVAGRFPGRAAKRGYTLPYVTAAGAAMGIPGLTPHALRGTCATLLSIEGAQVKAIQEGVMRHKDPRTTNGYIRPVLSSVREAGARVGEKAGFASTAPPFLAGPDQARHKRLVEGGTCSGRPRCSL